MNDSAGISVVVTCYNLRRYIGEAIQSVLAQNHDGDVELIVVDDCSTDGSDEIIRAHPCRYVRTAENSGVLLAMLSGMEAASHRRVAFLDGDDVWERAKLAAVSSAFESNASVALVTHDVRFIDDEGGVAPRNSRPQQVLGRLGPEEQCERVRQGILELGDYVWLGSALAVDRELGDVAGFAASARSLSDPRNTYQDWPLAYWIAARPDVRLEYVPEKLFRYRLHGANYSGDARSPTLAVRNLRRTLNTIEWIVRIGEERGLPEAYRRIAVERSLALRYMIDLNSGRRGRALHGFRRAIPDFRRRGLLFKELARLAAILLFGPDRFARTASGRTLFRHLPPT